MNTSGVLPNHQAIEYIPEIAVGDTAMLDYPTGASDLNVTVPWYAQSTSISTYEAYVHIQCNELGYMPTSFTFKNFI
jgi:hypothetical protein